MGTIIKEIKIPDENYSFISDDGEEGDILKNLSKINIFVGENNSGKSRLLRSLFYKYNDINVPIFVSNNKDFITLKQSISNFKEKIANFLDEWKINPEKVSFGDSNLEDALSKFELNFIIPNNDNNKPTIEFKESIKLIEKEQMYFQVPKGNITFEQIAQELQKKFDESFKDKKIEDTSFIKLYIPILRGLRYISGNYKDIYFDRTSRDYFDNLREGDLKNRFIEVFTGLTAYGTVKNHLLGSLNKRKLIKEFETYLSKQFFNNEPVALIPKEDGDQILTIKIGNEHEMPIYHLGDGIQSIIAITLPLFLREDEIRENESMLVFIEEPEHMLHPSLQRKLIETFLDERFEKYQFFFTTHSNHFLDVALDFEGISMFTSNKKLEGDNEEEIPKFIIKNVSFGDNNLLNMLGVRNSSVFLPNCNIWVEGISDVLYFRRYLNIYQDYMKSKDNNFKKFREDQHYSFYKYDGSDITNLLSLNLPDDDKRLERLFLIRDRDDSKDKNKKKKDTELKELLGDNFYLLGCREVENLLTKSVLLETIENDKKYRIISLDKNFEYENYKNIKLNKFITEKICKDPIDWNPIGSKRPFYNKAEKHIKEWNNLSKEAQELTEKIYTFIKTNNS